MAEAEAACTLNTGMVRRLRVYCSQNDCSTHILFACWYSILMMHVPREGFDGRHFNSPR